MRRENPGAGHRHARLQGLIFEELRSLLRDDVSDPALVGVRIRAVVLSVDYRHARVHFTIPRAPGDRDDLAEARPEDRLRIERALGRATPLLRSRLADSLDVKRVPDLRFIFDGIAPDDDDGEEGSSSTDEDPWSA